MSRVGRQAPDLGRGQDGGLTVEDVAWQAATAVPLMPMVSSPAADNDARYRDDERMTAPRMRTWRERPPP